LGGYAKKPHEAACLLTHGRTVDSRLGSALRQRFGEEHNLADHLVLMLDRVSEQ